MKTTLRLVLFTALIYLPLAYAKEVDLYITCMSVKKNQELCLESFGRDRWMPYVLPDDCILTK